MENPWPSGATGKCPELGCQAQPAPPPEGQQSGGQGSGLRPWATRRRPPRSCARDHCGPVPSAQHRCPRSRGRPDPKQGQSSGQTCSDVFPETFSYEKHDFKSRHRVCSSRRYSSPWLCLVCFILLFFPLSGWRIVRKRPGSVVPSTLQWIPVRDANIAFRRFPGRCGRPGRAGAQSRGGSPVRVSVSKRSSAGLSFKARPPVV